MNLSDNFDFLENHLDFLSSAKSTLSSELDIGSTDDRNILSHCLYVFVDPQKHEFRANPANQNTSKEAWTAINDTLVILREKIDAGLSGLADKGYCFSISHDELPFNDEFILSGLGRYLEQHYKKRGSNISIASTPSGTGFIRVSDFQKRIDSTGKSGDLLNTLK